jgi:hypothetical protein
LLCYCMCFSYLKLAGMSDWSFSPCGGDIGFSIVDTNGGRYKGDQLDRARTLYFIACIVWWVCFAVYYFQLQTRKDDNYSAVIDCVKTNGVSGCYHLATLWADVPL